GCGGGGGEAGGGGGRGRGGGAGEAHRGRSAHADRPVVGQHGRGGDVGDGHGGGVVGEAAVLVEDAAVNHWAGRAVVEREQLRGRRAGGRGAGGQAGRGQREAVVEAGGGVGRRRVRRIG